MWRRSSWLGKTLQTSRCLLLDRRHSRRAVETPLASHSHSQDCVVKYILFHALPRGSDCAKWHAKYFGTLRRESPAAMSLLRVTLWLTHAHPRHVSPPSRYCCSDDGRFSVHQDQDSQWPRRRVRWLHPSLRYSIHVRNIFSPSDILMKTADAASAVGECRTPLRLHGDFGKYIPDTQWSSLKR